MDESDAAVVARFVDPDADGTPISYASAGNPFQVAGCGPAVAAPPRTLAERAALARPRVPACLTRAPKAAAAAPAPAPAQRRLRMPEFVQQKRDVFLFQLFIDRKRRAAGRFRREAAGAERRLQEATRQIAAEIEAHKLASVQLEALLARARKGAELSAQEAARKRRELRHAEAEIDAARSRISKSEDTREQYAPYRELLARLCPPGERPEAFFASPLNLIDQLNKIENENLFLITHYQRLESAFAGGIDSLRADVAAALSVEARMLACISALEVQPSLDRDVAAQVHLQIRENDDALGVLKRKVQVAFNGCFRSAANIGTLEMLTRIERELERLYALCDRVVPEFLLYKQAVRERDRRERERKARQEYRAEEQRRKMEQAIARARKPIPRQTGRPLISRRLPITVKKEDDALVQRRLCEQQAEESLLFSMTDDPWQ
jgi:hypothetical protein